MSLLCKPDLGRPCRTCERPPSREPHTCPYLTDVHEGEPGCDRLCNCCDECTRECADDI